MSEIDYGRADFPVRSEVADGHKRYWQRLAEPGYWFTGAERIDMAKEVRNAPHCRLCQERKAVLSPNMVTGGHDKVTDLPDAIVEIIHHVITDPKRLTKKWFDRIVAQEVTPEQYIEIIGTTLHVFLIDEFCRGIGMPSFELPTPVLGAPSEYRPADTIDIDAWVEVLPFEIASDAPEADLNGKIGYNVFRGLSLAPDEVRTVVDLMGIHYISGEQVADVSVGIRETLDRFQTELVAARVSSFNQCYYCASIHSLMLGVSFHLSGLAEIDFSGLTDPNCHELKGIQHSRELIAFCDAFMSGNADDLATARQGLVDSMGPEALVDVVGVASNFQRMNRIADSTGIPSDPAPSEELGSMQKQLNQQLGISSYGSATNTLR